MGSGAQRSQSARGSVRPPRPQRRVSQLCSARGRRTDSAIPYRRTPRASWLGSGSLGGCRGGGLSWICLPAQRGRGRSPTRECARLSGSARQTDKPVKCQPCRLYAPTSLAFLAVCPSTPPPPLTHCSCLDLSQCQVGTVFRALTPRTHARAHGLTQIRPNLATVSHHLSHGDFISRAQPQRHTPLLRRADEGWGMSGRGVSPSAPLPAPWFLGCHFP